MRLSFKRPKLRRILPSRHKIAIAQVQDSCYSRAMRSFSLVTAVGVGLGLAGLSGCVDDSPEVSDDATSETESEVRTGDIWVHLDSNTGVNNATLSLLNNATTRCPSGRTSKACLATKLVLPADCNWECQDGLLSNRGEGVLRGRFVGSEFVVDFGYDTYSRGMGTTSVYRFTASTTCAQDPCPTAIMRQKLNSSTRPDAVTALDFTHAADPNFVLDPLRGYGQLTMAAGLVASGRMYRGTFRVDRVWRLETPKPACDPQLTAREVAYRGDDGEISEFRTQAEAMRAPNPNVDENGDPIGPLHWLVRTGESPSLVTFTAGANDLWTQRFNVDKTTCAVTITAEH